MTKARTLANFISDNNEFADGTISVAEVSGAAPLASPSFTGNLTVDTDTLYVDSSSDEVGINTSAPGGALDVRTANNGRFLVDLWGSQKQYYNDNVVSELNWTGSGDSWFKQYTNISSVNSLYNSFSSSGAIFNEDGADRDFRVESDSNANMLFVDAGSNHVNIGTSSDFGGTLNVAGVINQNRLAGITKFTDLSADLIHTGNYSATFSTGSGGTTQHSSVALWSDDHSSYSGQIHIVGNTSNGGSVNAAGEVEFWTFNGSSYTLEGYMGPRGYVFNEASRNVDFRVESNNQTHMLYVDAGANSVGIKTNATDAALNVNSQSSSTDAIRIVGSGGNNFIEMVGNQGQTAIRMWENGANDPGYTSWYNQGSPQHKIQSGANETVTFNEQGINTDFVVESQAQSHMLFVDASNSVVGIGDASTLSAGVRLHVNKNDTSTYGTNGVTIQNDVPVKIQNLNTSVNNIMSGIHIRSGTWDGGIIGCPTNNGVNNQGFMALIAETEEGARIYSSGGEGGTVINEHGVDRDFRVESNAQSHLFQVDAGTNQVRIGTQSSQIFAGSVPQLEIKTGGSGAGGLGIKSDSSTSSTKPAYSSWTRANGSGATAYAFQFYDGPTGFSVGNITVTNSATSYNTSSDYRLKENIVNLTGATERLKQLEPKRFNFIANADTTVDGFLAHEAQAVVPEAVIGEKDAVDEDGNPVYQGIDQAKLVPLLVATIKELEARITALENA